MFRRDLSSKIRATWLPLFPHRNANRQKGYRREQNALPYGVIPVQSLPNMTPLADEALFRTVMGSFPTGVAVVAARSKGGDPCGLTVNSLTSVSLRPLLLLVCLDESSETRAVVLESGSFAVNILRAGSEIVSNAFSRGGREHRFKTLPWREEVTGSPVFEDAVAWIDCRVEQAHLAGDHVIIVGRVQACGLHGGTPLVYLQGRYRRLIEPEALG